MRNEGTEGGRESTDECSVPVSLLFCARRSARIGLEGCPVAWKLCDSFAVDRAQGKEEGGETRFLGFGSFSCTLPFLLRSLSAECRSLGLKFPICTGAVIYLLLSPPSSDSRVWATRRGPRICLSRRSIELSQWRSLHTPDRARCSRTGARGSIPCVKHDVKVDVKPQTALKPRAWSAPSVPSLAY